MKKTILLTGATGYIGSHTWCALLAAGHNVIGLDNLCNSAAAVVGRIAQIFYGFISDRNKALFQALVVD